MLIHKGICEIQMNVDYLLEQLYIRLKESMKKIKNEIYNLVKEKL